MVYSWFQTYFLHIVPVIPSGFNITGVIYTVENLTVTFEWDEPRGSGPEVVVDTYIITIYPSPLTPSDVNRLPNSPLAFNATLDYNTTYMATITAENCAGRSETFVYPDRIEYST